MANIQMTKSNTYTQLSLLIHQIEALSHTLLTVDENISNELKLVEKGQLYFTLAKVKSKCEQMKERQSITQGNSSKAFGKANSDDLKMKNPPKPFQQFLEKYQDAFNLSDMSKEILNTQQIPNISPNINNGFWDITCEKSNKLHSTLDSQEGMSNVKASSFKYYDKSKSFFDNISNNDQLKKSKTQQKSTKKKNLETFGSTGKNLQFTNSHKAPLTSTKNKIHKLQSSYSNFVRGDVPSYLQQLASECVQVLTTSSDKTLSFKEFVKKYYELYKYKIEDVDKKRKLLDLLQEMPSVVTIIRKPNEELYVELL